MAETKKDVMDEELKEVNEAAEAETEAAENNQEEETKETEAQSDEATKEDEAEASGAEENKDKGLFGKKKKKDKKDEQIEDLNDRLRRQMQSSITSVSVPRKKNPRCLIWEQDPLSRRCSRLWIISREALQQYRRNRRMTLL